MKKITELVTFGCSMTYGHGLNDCYENSGAGSKPSSLAWPSILSQNLNLPIKNLSHPGSSNKRIWNTAIQHQFLSGQCAVFQWTYCTRSCILKSKTEIVDIYATNQSKISKIYYNHFYWDYDRMITDRLYVEHINWQLHMQDIPVINLGLDLYQSQNLFINIDHIPIYFDADPYKNLPKALDQKHPGELAHTSWALDLVPEIKSRLKINN
jgi:hypothetical protein